MKEDGSRRLPTTKEKESKRQKKQSQRVGVNYYKLLAKKNAEIEHE